MRGAIQYDDVLDSTHLERKMMLDYIDERMEYEIKKVKDSKGQLDPIY